MFDEKKYIAELFERLAPIFGERLLYVGLQGSYLRGEATEDSDLDIMMVVDGLSVRDLEAYRNVILSMEGYDKSCGFICGKDEMKHWNPLEICHLLRTTKDYFGTLKELVPEYTREDICRFVQMSVGNLYHEICHRYIHAPKERSVEALPFTYKGVFFILQNLHYLDTGKFINNKRELLEQLSGRDKTVLRIALDLSGGATCDFDEAFENLFDWCKEVMMKLA